MIKFLKEHYLNNDPNSLFHLSLFDVLTIIIAVPLVYMLMIVSIYILKAIN